MITFSIEPITNDNHTPAWIKPERYLYCDNFAQDFAESNHASILAFVRKMLQK